MLRAYKAYLYIIYLLADCVEQLPHGGAGVDDVLHDEDVLPGEVVQLVQADDVDLPGGLIVLVGLDPDEVHADLDGALGVVGVEAVDLVQHVREELVAALTIIIALIRSWILSVDLDCRLHLETVKSNPKSKNRNPRWITKYRLSLIKNLTLNS